MRKAIIMCAQLYTSCWWIFHRDIDSDWVILPSWEGHCRYNIQHCYYHYLYMHWCCRGRCRPYSYICCMELALLGKCMLFPAGQVVNTSEIYIHASLIISSFYYIQCCKDGLIYRRTNLKIDNILLSETPPHNRAISTWKQTIDQVYRVAANRRCFYSSRNTLEVYPDRVQ